MVLPPERRAAPVWPWLLAGAGLLALLAWVLRRRRAEPIEDDYVESIVEPEPVAAPLPEPEAPTFFSRTAPPPPAARRARLTLDLRPTRAGLNLLTATVSGEVTVVNAGDVAAEGIRAAVALLSAGAEQDESLVAFNDAPITRPVTPAFTLQPGEERRFRTVVALPHEHIRSLTVAGRPMFVPLVAVSLRWTDGGGKRAATQAFAVGVERVDSAKLAPIWLDVPPRNYDAVGARAQAPLQES
ncbi:hypothetical protein [Sphingomonas sp.]|uniref:hypothetical protein n=1 Tax=Sphingomonas sp. TaxID=28214 RepID=UPI002D800A60|nr:hypothetical protein [Sphingomonas sp.]HEU0045301.1 hypothetical protein [Sphingomonas sp.]